MKIQFHTPKGITVIDSDNVTDIELSKLNITREQMKESIPRDLTKEFDDLKIQLKLNGVID